MKYGFAAFVAVAIERLGLAACYIGLHGKPDVFEARYQQLRLNVCTCRRCGAYIEREEKITTQVDYDREVPFEHFKIEEIRNSDPTSAFYYGGGDRDLPRSMVPAVVLDGTAGQKPKKIDRVEAEAVRSDLAGAIGSDAEEGE
jgi:hypothetical protein